MDISTSYTDVFALSSLVIPIVAFIREHVWTELKAMHDRWTIAVALVTGIALGIGGLVLGTLDVPLIEAVIFGGVAGVLGSGLYDAGRSILNQKAEATIVVARPGEDADMTDDGEERAWTRS